MVAGGEQRADCCDCENLLLALLWAATWVDGGGVRDEGITMVAGLSSLISVLKDWLGSMGEAGISVEGKVTCDDDIGIGPASCGVDGSMGLTATRLSWRASSSAAEAMMGLDGES
jgi:hypothetical protein